MKHYVGSLTHPDAAILDRITEQFGSQLEALTRDDKAAVLICLVEAAINPQQIFIQENFFTNQNGGEVWNLAQQLSAGQQLALAVVIANQLTVGGQS
ncbi:MAG TPA: hypothetical protein V6D11_14915 [Waterburya sp.]|jgi:hypothetical protein